MGVVYEVEDRKLRRHLALKFLPPELARDAAALERFQRQTGVKPGSDRGQTRLKPGSDRGQTPTGAQKRAMCDEVACEVRRWEDPAAAKRVGTHACLRTKTKNPSVTVRQVRADEIKSARHPS